MSFYLINAAIGGIAGGSAGAYISPNQEVRPTYSIGSACVGIALAIITTAGGGAAFTTAAGFGLVAAMLFCDNLDDLKLKFVVPTICMIAGGCLAIL